ncbi:uncharacterized protein LOC144824465 [Lissotriton helveticus]
MSVRELHKRQGRIESRRGPALNGRLTERRSEQACSAPNSKKRVNLEDPGPAGQPVLTTDAAAEDSADPSGRERPVCSSRGWSVASRKSSGWRSWKWRRRRK